MLGQIAAQVTPDVTPVTPNVTPNARNQTQPILGPQRASLGQRMATPTHGPKTAQDGRGRGKEKGHAVRRGLGWLGVMACGLAVGDCYRSILET